MAVHTSEQYVGRAMLRKEDDRLLRGDGLFVADVRLPGMLQMAILRSSRAHARIASVDVSEAARQPGVFAALGYAELGVDTPTLPNLVPHRLLNAAMPYPLAKDRVRYVGEPVAVVVAESLYRAEDALEHIVVEYEDLDPVPDANAAMEPGAARLHDHVEGNVAGRMSQTIGDPDAGFARADVVVRLPFKFGRISGQPMETRGAVASYLPTKLGESFTIWSSNQMPHNARRVLSGLLGVPQQSVRVIAPDMGGGFGVKIYVYPEEYLVAHAARLLKRPVRWIGDRREDLLASYQAREQTHNLEVAASRDGRILGVRNRYVVDMGAYSPWGLVVPFNAATTLPGPYRIENYHVEMEAAYSNKSPMAPYRAAGRPPAVFAIEHAMDRVAGELGLDPAEVRRRNLVQPNAFPYRLGLIDRDGTEITYDSGNYPRCLDDALDLIDIDALRAEQRAARAEGRYLGVGIGCYVESSVRGPFEGATVRVEPDGKVLVVSGVAPQGQAHETILAQMCADRLGVPFDDITVVTGDTEKIGLGVGTFASRSAVVAGNAVSIAAQEVKEKALEVAAQLLEASVDDLELRDGVVAVKGVPDRFLTLAQIARVVTAPPPAFTFPPGLEPGLESTRYFHPNANTYSNGVHIGLVEVDVETGKVAIERYVVVHDCGKVINPMLVEGQVTGGVAQGVGNALYEEIVYDADAQPLTTSYMDYNMPTAMEVPSVLTGHVETLSPLNPEGIKGTGEGGTMPVPAVVANAIKDALKPLNITIDRMPISPSRLLALIEAATD